jgi:anti-anti-sigma regulatory factor
MAAQPLETQVRHQPGVAIIDLHGEIDSFAEAALNAAYAEAGQPALPAPGAQAQVGSPGDNPAAIVLNFSGVDYINSTGIALIVGLLAKARQSRRRLSVYGLSEHYVEIFHITRLADFMSLFPDEASALADMQASPV